MKTTTYVPVLLSAFIPVAAWGWMDFLPTIPPPHPPTSTIQQNLLKTGAVWTDSDGSDKEKDLLNALDNYDKAIAQYGRFSRRAQVAASDLDAAFEVYLEGPHPKQ